MTSELQDYQSGNQQTMGNLKNLAKDVSPYNRKKL